MLRNVFLCLGLAMALPLRGCTPELIAGDAAGGTVSLPDGFGNRGRAFAVAAEHCHKWGKLARVNGQNASTGILAFDCVRP
jgi:hypothetical protein